MTSVWPVTVSARQKVSACSATSSMEVVFFSFAASRHVETKLSGAPLLITVFSISPGATQFTRTSGASEAARNRVRPETAAFVG
jgi:hypothetical protein